MRKKRTCGILFVLSLSEPRTNPSGMNVLGPLLKFLRSGPILSITNQGIIDTVSEDAQLAPRINGASASPLEESWIGTGRVFAFARNVTEFPGPYAHTHKQRIEVFAVVQAEFASLEQWRRKFGAVNLPDQGFSGSRCDDVDADDEGKRQWTTDRGRRAGDSGLGAEDLRPEPALIPGSPKKRRWRPPQRTPPPCESGRVSFLLLLFVKRGHGHGTPTLFHASTVRLYWTLPKP